MEKNKLRHFKDLLLKEREEVLNTLKNRGENEFSTNLKDEIDELSMYDNHPGDIGTETFQMEMKYALETHEKEELKNVEEALKKIDKGGYGICEFCGTSILKERLEFLPSAKLCSKCADKRLNINEIHNDRPVEEEVLFPPFGRTNTDLDDSIVYDGEDAWQEIQQHSTSSDIDALDDEDRGIVEKIEEISNEDYKKQLPD
jgi:YteA family regulatory protein